MAEKVADVLVEENISNRVLKNASSRTTIASSVREVDGLVVLGMSQDDLDFYEAFTPQKRSRLNRKVCCGAVPGCQPMSITRCERVYFADCPPDSRLTFECFLFWLSCIWSRV